MAHTAHYIFIIIHQLVIQQGIHRISVFGKKSNISHDFDSFRGGEKDRVLNNGKTI